MLHIFHLLSTSDGIKFLLSNVSSPDGVLFITSLNHLLLTLAHEPSPQKPSLIVQKQLEILITQADEDSSRQSIMLCDRILDRGIIWERRYVTASRKRSSGSCVSIPAAVIKVHVSGT